VDGPFRRLTGRWQFSGTAGAVLQGELAAAIPVCGWPLGRLIAPVFDSIAGSLIDAFARRAESQYG